MSGKLSYSLHLILYRSLIMHRFSFLRVAPILPLVGWCLFFWSFLFSLHLGVIAQDPGAREVLEVLGASSEQIEYIERALCPEGYKCKLTESTWRWGSSDTLAMSTLKSNLRILRGEK